MRPRNAGSASAPRRRGIATEADVDKARAYCQGQLRTGDYEAYLIRRFVPRPSRDAYDALRALNLELARLPETVSTPLLGRMRTQFWRDSVNSTFAGKPPREPICILLHRALSDLSSRQTSGGGGGGGAPSSPLSIRFWVQRLISTRELHIDNRPFASLAALEEYAENTYATLTYAVLAAAPLRSLHLDHLASHIGKACGIVAVLRGIPILAAPRAPVQTPMGGGGGGGGQQQALLLPLDVMARAGVREEDVFRQGPHAPGLQDAVFEVATRANDHLITAREMLKNLRAGKGAGHDYEHEGEAGHVYEDREGPQLQQQQPGAAADEQVAADLRRGFGALLEAVPAADFLQRLEKQNFDPFKVRPSWKLPWSIWRALQKQQI